MGELKKELTMKLHLGCGKRNFGPDWIHIDRDDLPHIQSKDITLGGYQDDTIDLIYSAHLIAYFDREQIIPILENWKRRLKPGGILRIAVPDFEAIVKLYFDQQFHLTSFLGPLYGKMEVNKDSEGKNGAIIYHKTVYDFRSLRELLIGAGFKNIERYDWKTTEHAYHDDHSQSYLPHMNKETGTLISLNVQCNK